jgi:23S rRNA A2030 N6-methylase RlmJ
LRGSGRSVVNPPFTLEGELQRLLPALAGMLSPLASARSDWLTRRRPQTA